MMTIELEAIDQRLGYKESCTITRDELNAIESTIVDGESAYWVLQKEFDDLKSVQKQLALARGVIDGIVECIDDEGVVTEGDRRLLASHIKAAARLASSYLG